MNTRELIERINNTLKKNKQLVNNLQSIIEIASKFNHQSVINWANRELYGYEEEDEKPPYRKIEYFGYKEESALIPDRIFMEYCSWLRPITDVIKDSKKKDSQYTGTNIWGTQYTYAIEKQKFISIIKGVKLKIKEYLQKVSEPPQSIVKGLGMSQDRRLTEYQSKKSAELEALNNTELLTYFTNDKEKVIFRNNLKSLLKFEYTSNYKYCLIAMGSILEFLLEKYCKAKTIAPEFFKGRKGKTFANFIEAAIEKDIFGEKSRWQIVQSHLRDFRNYVHILKEVKSTQIDQKWYETMKPIFEVLYDQFKKVKI